MYAAGLNDETPFTFANAVPGLKFFWTSTNPDVCQVKSVYVLVSDVNFFKAKRVFVKNVLVQTKKILIEICNFNSLPLSALFGINYFAPIY